MDRERERGQYAVLLTEPACSVNNLLYGLPSLHVASCFYICICRFLLQNVFLELIILFSLFSFSLTLLAFSLPNSIQTEKSQKIFTVMENIFYERKLSCTRLDLGEILLRERRGNPEQAVSLHLARSGSQSQRGI